MLVEGILGHRQARKSLEQDGEHILGFIVSVEACELQGDPLESELQPVVVLGCQGRQSCCSKRAADQFWGEDWGFWIGIQEEKSESLGQILEPSWGSLSGSGEPC